MSKQWIVDESGLTGNGDYWIEKSRLLELRDGLYEWPLHVCTKKWVDFADFRSAFELALVTHRKRYSKRLLAATFKKCERQIAHNRAYSALCREMFPEKYSRSIQLWSLTEMNAVSDELSRRYAQAREADDGRLAA